MNFNETQKNDIIQRFLNKERLYQIAQSYNCNYTTIRRYLKKWIKYENSYNLKNSCDEDYFSRIDTKYKAYFLGLLYADGCVRDGEKRSKQLMITLEKDDKNILEKFSKELNYSGKLYFLDKRHKFFEYESRRYQCSSYYRLHISNDKLCNDLIKLGCTPRKTKKLFFPTIEQVPEQFLSYFILGYFDGDGMISVSKKYNRASIGFCGTKAFLKELSNILNKLFNRIKTKTIEKRQGSYYVCYSKRQEIELFHALMYKDIDIFMQRKKSKFQEFLFQE